jgi:short-subunit dehydrogenase
MAVQLAGEGWSVALTGRREAKLAEACKAVEAAGGKALPILGGVEDLAVVKEHYAKIKAAWGGLDCAILNAGVGNSNDAKSFSAKNVRWTFETNIFGVANWMEAVLPDMIAAKSGVIAGIASLAAFKGLPSSGDYSASKAALFTLLESARIDLLGTGVDVVIVCPGFVKSEITDRNEPGSMPFLLETEDGASRILNGIRRRARVVHFPWQLSYLARYVLQPMPGFLYDVVGRRIKRKKKPYVDESKAGAGSRG